VKVWRAGKGEVLQSRLRLHPCMQRSTHRSIIFCSIMAIAAINVKLPTESKVAQNRVAAVGRGGAAIASDCMSAPSQAVIPTEVDRTLFLLHGC
jgi:hypothetical protein